MDMTYQNKPLHLLDGLTVSAPGMVKHSRHPLKGMGFVLFLTTILFSFQVHADANYGCDTSHSTDWMAVGKVGLSSHYFAQTADQLEKMPAQLKIDEVANQAATAGAAWFLFPIYHQPWRMMAPNETYDHILGQKGFTTSRDVPLELYNALHPKGIRLMLYVNLQLAPNSATPEAVRQAIGGWPPNDKLVHNIAAIYREFSLRYGKRVSGWWIDGVQRGSEWGRSPYRELWFKEIAEAVRAGNPDAIVAFNPGLATVRYSQQNDYIAGESTNISPLPSGRCLDGAQWHLWTYLGETWGSGGTRFSNDDLFKYARFVALAGGAITFEVGMTGMVKSDDTSHNILNPENIGRIDPGQVAQIHFVTQRIRQLDQGFK